MNREEGRRIQTALQTHGFYHGLVDGVVGPVTYSGLFGFIAGRDSQTTVGLGSAAAGCLGDCVITTPLRLAHFLAQCAHETGRFKFMRELWGPTPAQVRYETRADLGNVQPGDGFRFRGRGIFQLTGRDNYAAYGRRLKLELVAQPDLAARPDIALRIACQYWTDHRLNSFADADNVLAVSNGINRGNPGDLRAPNGFPERKAELKRVKAVLL